MTKETQTQAIAEPFKFKNAALLNRLSEMAQVPYYATACHTLIQAEMAIVELERENATLRAEVERLAAQSAPTEAPQEFESAQGRALASAWAEGWTQCRDAEYAGEEAQSEAFNQSYTLAQCLHADQTRLQGGLSNDQLRRAWGAKLPRVIPTDEQLTAFALGIEVAVAQSAPLAQQAAEPTYTDDLELRYAEVCEERDHLRAVLRAQSPAQAPVQPVSLTDVLQAAAPTEIADALAPVVQAGEPGKYDDVLKPFFTLMERELHANSGKGDRSGWLAMKPDQALLEVYHHVAKLAKAVRDNDGPGIMEYGADVANMAMMVLDLCGSLAWVDAYRASSGAAQAVRMLTREELNDVALSEQVGWEPGEYVEAVQRKFAEVNGLRIPADGVIGGV